MADLPNTISLNILLDSLPYGSLMTLAEKLNCHPSKITNARRGLVRNKSFLDRLQSEAKKMQEEMLLTISK